MVKALSRDDVAKTLSAFFVEKSRSPDLLIPESLPPEPLASVRWIDRILEQAELHEEDFIVFGHFRDRSATILDVGANYGYSAASIWASGAASSVISFEPIGYFEPMLRRIRQLRPGLYDFAITGLGDRAGVIRLTTPVVNGELADGLTTAVDIPDLEGMTTNILRRAAKENSEVFSLQFYQFTSSVTPLDHILVNRRFDVSTKNIVAIKIDTEGYEPYVIAGAKETIAFHRPLIMTEGGCWNPLINEILLPLGYLFATRTGNKLRLVDAPTNTVNGFYVHSKNVASYIAAELLDRG